MRKKIFLLFAIAISIASNAQLVTNQIGFYPNGPKQAVVINGALNKDFRLVDAQTGAIAYEGKLGEPIQSKNSSLITRIADFSDFTKPGSYKIIAGQFETPGAITIGKDVQREAAKGALKGYYYQRVSIPLEEKYAGKWARPAGHPDDVVYVHSSAATKKRPETGNGAPDILNEAAYNLRWMLAMQDSYDGGVYNKLTNASFDAMDAKPGQTKEPRYVVQKGTAATLDFAAVTAQAARIYKNFPAAYPQLADSCLKAAKKAWEWALKNPNLSYDQNRMNKEHKPAISTGGYGDGSYKDEWFWAAAELYLTTKDVKFKKTIDANALEKIQIPNWGYVYTLGVYSLLRLKDAEYDTQFRPALLALADELVDAIPTNAFGVVMGKDRSDFIWGSSSQAANQGILLINAYLLTKDSKYLYGAATNMDYLLGKNATGYSFLTGYGYRSVRNPHHRPSVSDNIEDPVPGLLSGGPNPMAVRSDGQYYEFTESETAFSDVQGSYAANEIAINWNAPAVYLFNAIEAEQNNLKK
ncbi:endoglucanase [Bacteroidia bacterium]|nr:endoglucanase [Bacteroidia bacterium]